jgi:hypothetical protein
MVKKESGKVVNIFHVEFLFVNMPPKALGFDIWSQPDRRTDRTDGQIPEMTASLKFHQNRYISRVTRHTAKVSYVCHLEVCNNYGVLAIKCIVFLYSVCWKYFHPNRHLASYVRARCAQTSM